ncbi:glycosyltransferase 61 family protein [Nocardioides sp.]|uniref:glycosyltransferase family 61 protein n=1 Tax=Nocardioides sp. TaxID=35761 RepID=UPI0025F2CCFC|nr:glycosyltransferase 61 family protein [Nocardioides sp.]
MPIIVSATLTAPNYDNETSRLTGAVYDEDGTLVATCLRDSRLAWKHDDPETLPSPPTNAERLREARYLGRYIGHFGHFLIETLPALARAGFDDLPLLFHPWGVPDAPGAGYRAFLLNALGIDEARIGFVRRVTVVDKLHVPDSLPNVILGDVDRATLDAYAFIRQAALRVTQATPHGGAIYLSRRAFDGRREVKGEDTVEDAFRRDGYTVIHPQQLPIHEQIGLVARAEAVAGFEGSALHLCGFMRPGSRVTVVTQDRPVPLAILAVNDALGHVTTVIPSTGVG